MVGTDGVVQTETLNAVVRASPRAIAETDPADTVWAWDVATRTLSLSYDGVSDGITEVVVPPWWYRDGVVVTGSGGCQMVSGDRVFIQATGGPVQLVVSPPA